MTCKVSTKICMQMCFCIAVIIFSNCALAQVPAWKWGRGAIATGFEGAIVGFDIQGDMSGNSYAVGYSSPNCNPYFGGPDTLNGYCSPFLVKYDSLGNTLWAKTAVGLPDRASLYYCNAVDKQGNVYVAGWSGSDTLIAGNDTLLLHGDYSRGIFRSFLIKYDQWGNVVWTRKLNHRVADPYCCPPYEAINRMKIDANENIIITGRLLSYDSSYYWLFGTDSIFGSSYFVAKYDSAGNALWGKPYGFLGLAVDTLGNIFVAGDCADTLPYKVFGTDTLYGHKKLASDTDYCISYIAKLSSGGTLIKAVNCGAIISRNDGSYGDIPYRRGLAVDNDGNVYLSSDWLDTLFIATDTIIGSAGPWGYPFFVAKYNNNLAFSWVKTYEDYGYGLIFDIFCNVSNDIYLCGGIHAPPGYRDLPVFKIDSAGTFIWSKEAVNAGVLAGSINNAGDIFVTGPCNYGRPVSLDGYTISPSSGYYTSGYYWRGYYAAKLGSDAGLDVRNISNASTSALVYPNPVEASFILKVDPVLVGENYSVVDLVGKTILTGRISEESSEVDSDAISPGVYLLRIKNVTIKIVKI